MNSRQSDHRPRRLDFGKWAADFAHLFEMLQRGGSHAEEAGDVEQKSAKD